MQLIACGGGVQDISCLTCVKPKIESTRGCRFFRSILWMFRLPLESGGAFFPFGTPTPPHFYLPQPKKGGIRPTTTTPKQNSPTISKPGICSSPTIFPSAIPSEIRQWWRPGGASQGGVEVSSQHPDEASGQVDWLRALSVRAASRPSTPAEAPQTVSWSSATTCQIPIGRRSCRRHWVPQTPTVDN